MLSWQVFRRTQAILLVFSTMKEKAWRFFMDKIMPETATRLARIKAGARSVMALPADAF